MPTISDAIEQVEERLLVGRCRELDRFAAWLHEPRPNHPLLNVTGPAGVGKSTLVRAFSRLARAGGRQVVFLDGASLGSTPGAVLEAFGGGTAGDVVARLNASRPLVVVDAFGEISTLSHVVQAMLEDLDVGVRTVVASRLPLAMVWGPRWAPVVDTLELDGLADDECREYLARRGVRDHQQVAQLLAASGRLPLSLALATDMVTRLGITSLAHAPQWHLALHSLVNQLLAEVEDADLRALLDAAALLRRFDEELLLAVSGATDVQGSFTRLAQLSIVRPVRHGLAVHADIRRLVAEELRWRRPDRYRELRDRALSAYRERFARSSPADRARLVPDRLYLWEHSFVRSMLFAADDGDDVWIDAGRPADREPIIEAWFAWLDAVPTPRAPDPAEVERERRWLHRFLDHQALNLRVFRDGSGEMTGYLATIPVYAGSVELLRSHPYRGQVVGAYLGARRDVVLPDDPARASITYLFQLSAAAHDRGVTYPAILREAVGAFAAGGTFLATPIPDEHRVMTSALGFKPVPGGSGDFRGRAFDGVVLELEAIGFEHWLGAIMRGKRPPTPLSPEEFERELQTVLTQWGDDQALAASPLAVLAEADTDASVALVAGSLRQVVQVALKRASAGLEGDHLLPYRAIELAYLRRSVSHERVAERLNVSRSTFYRLLRRGARGLAATLREG